MSRQGNLVAHLGLFLINPGVGHVRFDLAIKVVVDIVLDWDVLVISEFAIFWLALAISGSMLGAEYLGDYVLALIFGIAFQYFAIAPMRGLGLKDGLKAAAKADFISLTFFEVGLFAWMAIMTFVLFPAPHQLMANSASFWLLMQVGMMVGYATSWPANVWLGINCPV